VAYRASCTGHLGRDDVPITGPAAITVMEYVCVAVAPSESLTLTMNENAPAAVGAPVMIPDDMLRDKPGGSAEAGAESPSPIAVWRDTIAGHQLLLRISHILISRRQGFAGSTKVLAADNRIAESGRFFTFVEPVECWPWDVVFRRPLATWPGPNCLKNGVRSYP